ncbi:unannotated protein [freshwater metagenome]|uniref:Unannotated protein n=1 Tax=freshwater metagenome TaxID=449393 RepID=A0A6J6WVS5_9ZZZZ
MRTKEIDMSGTLMDNIQCEGLLKIRKTGKVSGQLFYADLDIERGGQFEGQMVNSSK